MKKNIKHLKASLDSNFKSSENSKWEFYKYEIRKFTEKYPKNNAKLTYEKVLSLENKIKVYSKK